MFWKNTAWAWENAAGNDDDDGGYLLAADLRRTPDSTPDADLNCIITNTTVAATNLSNCNTATAAITTTTTTTGLKDLTNHNPTASSSRPNGRSLANSNSSSAPTKPNYGNYVSPLFTNDNQKFARSQDNNIISIQRLTVSLKITALSHF